MDLLRDRCPMLLKRVSSFGGIHAESAGLSRGGASREEGSSGSPRGWTTRKRQRTSESTDVEEDSDSEGAESWEDTSASEDLTSSSICNPCPDEAQSVLPSVPGEGRPGRGPDVQPARHSPAPQRLERERREPAPLKLPGDGGEAVLHVGPGPSFLGLLGSRAVCGSFEAEKAKQSKPAALAGAELISGRELLESLACHTLVASGCRGTDVLRWLRSHGPENFFWDVEVHDPGLLRNVLYGSAPDACVQACVAPSVASLKETLKVASELARQLRAASRELAYVLLLRAQAAVTAMEATGIPFDYVGMEKLCVQWRTQIAHTEADVRKQLLDACGVSALRLNLRSNSQIAGLLALQLSPEERAMWPCTPGGALRTDSASLRRSNLPWVEDVVRFRELSHALSHYESYAAAARCGGGRLFPSYQLAGAVTGRMTCANPNLQSSPRMEEFRSLFRAGLRPGWDWLVQGDFSQIELRVLAELAGDEQMQGIFAAGEDLHATTAALLSGVAPAEVSSQQRQFAKAVNFGLVYGQSAEGLQKSAENSYGIELSYAEACRARQGFLAAYPAVAEWQQRQRDLAMRRAEVRTKGGRPACHLVEQWKDLQGGHCDASSSGRLQREAINFPVQGTAAEVMMACLESLHAFLQRASATVRLVCVVHDEFLLECADPAAAEEAVGALREAMEDAWRRLFPGAVLGATGISVRKGLSWSELK